MKDRNVIRVEFSRDEKSIHTRGLYWLVVKYSDNTEVSEMFTEGDLKQMIPFAKKEGYAGRIPLQNWLAENRPTFYSRAVAVTPDVVVPQLLEHLKVLSDIDN